MNSQAVEVLHVHMPECHLTHAVDSADKQITRLNWRMAGAWNNELIQLGMQQA